LSEHGGRPGGPQVGCVDAKLGAAWTAEEYVGGEAGIEGLTFATFLAFYLAKGHCFTDGNKRVAWLSMVDVLAALGLRIEVGHDEAAKFMDGVAGEGTKPEHVREWVADRLRGIEE
jgi:death-on-curing protein